MQGFNLRLMENLIVISYVGRYRLDRCQSLDKF